MLLGNGEAGMREGIADQAVRVEIDLPVVLVVAVRANGEHGARKVEGQDLDIGCGLGDHVRHLGERRFQQRNGGLRVDTVRQLRRQFDTPVGVGGKVLNGVAENLAVTDDGLYVVGGIEGSGKQADGLDRAGHSGGSDEVAHLEGLQDHQKRAAGEVR